MDKKYSAARFVANLVDFHKFVVFFSCEFGVWLVDSTEH